MKSFRCLIYFLALIMIFPLTGCNSSEHKNNKKSSEEGRGHEESPSGASFKPGKGVSLTDETSRIVGLEVVEVAEEKLPRLIRFNVQIFGEEHRYAHIDLDHTGCDVHGSGFVTPEKAKFIDKNQPVKLFTSTSETLDGFVVTVQKPLAYDETEVIVGVTSAGTKLKEGEFLSASIILSRDETVIVIPTSALLRTSEGTFVYVLNGDAYYRTAVQVGSESNDKIEIEDGLFMGDQVVVKPVETLWLIELRATKGGGHSH